MIFYRICREKFCRDLSGKGAELYGGRWNSKGRPALYTSSSIALATVEVAVHLPLNLVPADFMLVIIRLPLTDKRASVTELKKEELPKSWNVYPFPVATQKRGDEFLAEANYLAMSIPSAAVEGDRNYLVNPLHPLAARMQIEEIRPYAFDQRLFVREPL